MAFFERLNIKGRGRFFLKNVYLLIIFFLVIVFFVGVMISEKLIFENDKKIEESVMRECEYLSIVSEEMIDVVVTQVKNITLFTELKYIFRDSPSDWYYYESNAQVTTKLRDITDMNPNIDSIYLYSKYRDEVFTDKGTILYDIFTDKSWEKEYLDAKKTEFKIFFRDAQNEKVMLTFLYNFKSDNDMDGCIIVNVDMMEFMSAIQKDGFFVVSTNDNKSFFMTQSDNQREVVRNLIENKDSGIVKEQGEYYGISKKQSQYGNFIYAYILYLEEYKSGSLIMYIKITLVILILIAMFAFIAFKIAEMMYKPIKEIGEILENPNSYKSKKFLENDVNTKKITDKIFNVVYTNEMLYHELNTKMDNFNYAQLKALQWQINPHFIFNTLNMLYLMTEDIAGKGNEASQGILLLSKLIRYSLKTEPITVPLSEELELVNEYVKIMSARLDGTVDFELIADENIKDKKIIKMCIQPILENAFRYGVKNLKRKGKIEVRITEKEDFIEIEISDNGFGMTEEKLLEIRENLKKQPEISENHIGLLNVNSRLKLLYGEDYGIKIESVLDGGTKVSFKCPNNSRKI